MTVNMLSLGKMNTLYNTTPKVKDTSKSFQQVTRSYKTHKCAISNHNVANAFIHYLSINALHNISITMFKLLLLKLNFPVKVALKCLLNLLLYVNVNVFIEPPIFILS